MPAHTKLYTYTHNLASNAQEPQHRHTKARKSTQAGVLLYFGLLSFKQLAPGPVAAYDCRDNVNPGLINPWLINRGCPLLVGIQTTFGGNTPLIMGRVY